MPVIKSAKKKLRQDVKRRAANQKVRDALKRAIKQAEKNPSLKTLQEATKLTDKAAMQHILHKNKAARIKSTLAKRLAKNPEKKASTPKKKAPTQRNPQTTA